MGRRQNAEPPSAGPDLDCRKRWSRAGSYPASADVSAGLGKSAPLPWGIVFSGDQWPPPPRGLRGPNALRSASAKSWHFDKVVSGRSSKDGRYDVAQRFNVVGFRTATGSATPGLRMRPATPSFLYRQIPWRSIRRNAFWRTNLIMSGRTQRLWTWTRTGDLDVVVAVLGSIFPWDALVGQSGGCWRTKGARFYATHVVCWMMCVGWLMWSRVTWTAYG
jgi:hypothetical protein